MTIPKVLVRRFAVEYFGTDRNLSALLYDEADPLHSDLVAFLESIDSRTVEAHAQSVVFRDCNEHLDESQRDRVARCEVAEILISTEIENWRKELLIRQSDVRVPEPYCHPDLGDIEFDGDRLVKASLFDRREGAYGRGDTVFQLLPTLLDRANSVYWVDLVLQRLPKDVEVRVRLDPLIRASRVGYLTPVFAMRAYGPPLDWERLKSMRDGYIEAGLWYPDKGAETEVAFTDYVWSRTGGELQFTCEEVPTPEASVRRGGRYLHSIYMPDTGRFIHADGAIRFFEQEEIEQRATKHVREAGKLGRRVKVFRADGPIPRDEWCSLAASFFVWNDEVRGYFKRSGAGTGSSAA